MASLSLRKLPEDLHRRLRLRAARHGRSMEAEARAILAEACGTPENDRGGDAVHRLLTWVHEVYGGRLPRGAVDDLIAERRREARRE